MSLTAFQRYRRLQQVEAMKPENIKPQEPVPEEVKEEVREEVIEEAPVAKVEEPVKEEVKEEAPVARRSRRK